MHTVNFFTYFLTFNQSSVREKTAKTLILQMFYAAFFGATIAIVCNFNILVFLFGFMAFFAAIPQQWARGVKPNLTSIVPLTQTRKTVYNLLSIPAMFVFSILVSGVIILSVWLFSGLCAAAIVGNASMILSIFSMYTEGLSKVFEDGYAVLIFISLLIFIMGAGTIYAHTDSKKYRNITAVALFLVALTGSEVLLQMALKYEISPISLKVTHIAGYAGANIKFLPLPWLAVLLCALVSLSVLGVGLYLAIKKNKAKNY